MQRLEVKNKIKLTYVFEEPVKGFDVYLYQIDEREGRFGARAYYYEVQGCVVAVGY